jgi:hypothetical protein
MKTRSFVSKYGFKKKKINKNKNKFKIQISNLIFKMGFKIK